MRTRNRSSVGTEVWWVWLTAILKSMRSRPGGWLMSIWLAGWALFAWHAMYPTSWEAVWGALHNAVSPARTGSDGQGRLSWLYDLGRWGQIALYISTSLLALYVSYALWVWRRYARDWMHRAREERLRGGSALQVIVPPGSKADARAASDMFAQLWNFLSGLSQRGTADGYLGARTGGLGKVGAERLALSLEMWSTPHTDGKVGFYVWCPGTAGQHRGRDEGAHGRGLDDENSRITREVRHLIMVHHPGCRVRWVEDPLKCSLAELVRSPGAPEPFAASKGPEEPGRSQGLHDSLALQASDKTVPGSSGIAVAWYELGLLADSLYPIGSGASDQRLLKGTRAAGRPGSPGAGSDPLAMVIEMLGSDKSMPIVGVQIVIAARPETSGQTQQAVNKELARLRDLEAQLGKKALGPQHEARVLALEEKADRQGYDVIIRLVVAERVEGAPGETGEQPGRADARLASLLRAFSQYDRGTAGVTQGLRVVRKARATLLTPQQVAPTPSRLSPRSSRPVSSLFQGHATGLATNLAGEAPAATEASQGDIARGYVGYRANLRDWMRRVAPLVGRWPREGVCMPRMLPFIRMGRACILNMAELSALYHFPHQGLEGLSTLRWGSYKQIPPPAFAHVTAEQVARGERVAFGGLDVDMPPVKAPAPAQALMRAPTGDLIPAIETHTMSQPADILPAGAGSDPGGIGVGTYPQDLGRGSYVLGPMGSGKSVFLYNSIVQYLAAGRGIGLIDGKGDSYEEILRLVPPHLEGEVLTFDPENRHAGRTGGGRSGRTGTTGGRSIGINPLDGRVVAQLGVEQVESMTMGLMRKMMGANWNQSVLMQRFLRDSVLGVLEAEPAPTMLNLWRWLQDDGKGGNEYREALVGKIRNQLVQDFWQHQVPAMSSQQRSSMQNVLTRVDRYVKNYVRYVILQPYSTVNFQDVMDRGTIFVGRVSPRLGEDQSFLGALMLNGFLTGAFARQAIPQEQRRGYLLVVDEFQNFVDTGQADVERMLSMARSYRLGLMLAHQYTEQLPKEVLSAILSNVQTWVLFGLQASDARLIAGHMEGLQAVDFQNLPPYHTYQRTIVDNTPTGAYSALPLPPPRRAANPGEVGERGERERRSGPGSGGRSGGSRKQNPREERQERERARDTLRAANASEEVLRLVRGEVGEGEEARRARILKLTRELYWPAEEGDTVVVQALSLLNTEDLDLYRRVRCGVLDRAERERLLAEPWLVPDKAERIERLSSLRWGTPCVEVEALVLAALRKDPIRPEQSEKGTTAYGKLAGSS